MNLAAMLSTSVTSLDEHWLTCKERCKAPKPCKVKIAAKRETPSLDMYRALMGSEPFTPYMMAHKADVSPRVAATVLCRYVNAGKVIKVGRIGDCRRNVWYQFGE